MENYIGIDYGTKRVGVAICNSGSTLAFPHAAYTNDSDLITKVIKDCQENSITTVVIGESKNFSGVENPIMKQVKIFAQELKEVLPDVEIKYEPEFLTSAQAERLQTPDFLRNKQGNKSSVTRKGRNNKNKQWKKDSLDASAATIILQSYLDKVSNKT